MKNVIVVTGASSGFGALAARALARAEHIVYASMRETKGRNADQVKEVEKYAADHGVDLRVVELDVSSQKSCDAGIQEIISKNGRLDVVVHNAGHMVFGPAEAFTPEQLGELYDINVLSTQRVNRAALPQLRKQGQGLVVWVSSSSAAGGTPPYLAPYFAAKAGMDALAVVYSRESVRDIKAPSRKFLPLQAAPGLVDGWLRPPDTARTTACQRISVAQGTGGDRSKRRANKPRRPWRPDGAHALSAAAWLVSSDAANGGARSVSSRDAATAARIARIASGSSTVPIKRKRPPQAADAGQRRRFFDNGISLA